MPGSCEHFNSGATSMNYTNVECERRFRTPRLLLDVWIRSCGDTYSRCRRLLAASTPHAIGNHPRDARSPGIRDGTELWKPTQPDAVTGAGDTCADESPLLFASADRFTKSGLFVLRDSCRNHCRQNPNDHCSLKEVVSSRKRCACSDANLWSTFSLDIFTSSTKKRSWLIGMSN